MTEPVLSLRGVSKSFGGIKALREVDFDLLAGEIHAIAGENGAGKSTLMNIIAGIHRPDSGTIRLHGKDVVIDSPVKAQQLGIAIVHQEIALCPDVSVAENVMMPLINTSRSVFVNYRAIHRKAAEILGQFTSLSPDAQLGSLSISSQQLVEIARALCVECDILILDEPTAALTQSEAEMLFGVMRELKARGIAVIFISHRTSEVFAQCDRVTVLRDGRLVATDNVADVTPEIMIRHLVGREVSTLYPPKPAAAPGKVLLEVAGLGDGARITDVSFAMRQGEILGMAGLIGSGRTETMECLCGLRPATTGSIRLLGEPFSPKRYPHAIAKGLVYLSENRKSDGVFLNLPIDQNISALDLGAVSTIYRFIDRRKELQQAEEACRKLSIKTSGTAQRVSELSGGNQQKVAIAKLLAVAPKVILMDEPTRGIDVNAKAEVHRLLRQLVEEGIGVIVVSSEIQEIVGLCDRVLVMYEGQPRGTLEGNEVTEDNIVQLAAGLRSTRPHQMEMVS
jgi:ribose transport system ATP-binding protein